MSFATFSVRSMSTGGGLELIQSFNNPKIIDAPDSSLQEGKLHTRWKLLIVLRDFLQLPKLFIEMEDKLFSSTFKVIMKNSFTSHTIDNCNGIKGNAMSHVWHTTT